MHLIPQDRYTHHEVTASSGGSLSGRTAPKRESSKMNPESAACRPSPDLFPSSGCQGGELR